MYIPAHDNATYNIILMQRLSEHHIGPTRVVMQIDAFALTLTEYKTEL